MATSSTSSCGGVMQTSCAAGGPTTCTFTRIPQFQRTKGEAFAQVLQRVMGHASAALTLDRYGHLMPGQARSVADRLDEMARRARPLPDAPVTPLRPAAQSGAGGG
jgi:hypothetical protein